MTTTDSPVAKPKTISGRVAVLGIFGFGIASTALIWFYWNQHIQPYMPVQLAIAEEFPDSSPRVEGGQRKIHKESPRIYRVTMRTVWDPTGEDEETTARVDSMMDSVARISQESLDLSTFDVFALHLYSPAPEQALRQKTFERDIADLPGAPAADASK